jgi:quercetin dioxygenase-like cupin family protein
MIDISTIESREIVKGYQARFIHTEHTTLAFWEVEKGAVLPMHSHVHEQIMQVLEGTFELTIDNESNIYKQGLMVVIPSNAVHGGTALTDCKLFDIFSPVREDYKIQK